MLHKKKRQVWGRHQPERWHPIYRFSWWASQHSSVLSTVSSDQNVKKKTHLFFTHFNHRRSVYYLKTASRGVLSGRAGKGSRPWRKRFPTRPAASETATNRSTARTLSSSPARPGGTYSCPFFGPHSCRWNLTSQSVWISPWGGTTTKNKTNEIRS